MLPSSVHSLSAVACALAAGLALAPRSAPAPQDPQRPAAKFVLEAGSHGLGDLLVRSARFLKRNHLLDPAAANLSDMQVTLDNPLSLDAAACEEVVCQLAFTKGLAMVPVDVERGIWEWIAIQGPRRQEITARALLMSPDEVVKKRRLIGLPVLVTMPLEHVNAQLAVNGLRPFFSGPMPGHSLTVGAAGNAVLLQGFASNVAAAIELLAKVDVQQPDAEDPAQWRREIERRLKALEKKQDR